MNKVERVLKQVNKLSEEEKKILLAKLKANDVSRGTTKEPPGKGWILVALIIGALWIGINIIQSSLYPLENKARLGTFPVYTYLFALGMFKLGACTLTGFQSWVHKQYLCGLIVPAGSSGFQQTWLTSKKAVLHLSTSWIIPEVVFLAMVLYQGWNYILGAALVLEIVLGVLSGRVKSFISKRMKEAQQEGVVRVNGKPNPNYVATFTTFQAAVDILHHLSWFIQPVAILFMFQEYGTEQGLLLMSLMVPCIATARSLSKMVSDLTGALTYVRK